MSILKKTVFFLVLAGFALSAMQAQTLTIYTEENSPLQTMGTDNVLQGLSVDLVKEIQKRVGNTDELKLVPWARGYDAALKVPNVVLFSTTRTAARDPLFHWVGPVAETRYAFYSVADSKLQIKSLDDAKKVGYVGVVLNDVRDQLLTKEGFPNLTRANNYETSLKQLLAGRIDLSVCGVNTIESQLILLGAKLSDVKLQYVFLRAQLWIVFSKDSDPVVVKKWNDAFEAMKKDGTTDKIYSKYPDWLRPGPTITTF